MRASLLSRTEAAHDDSVWGCAWSPAGVSTLVTGSVDESVKLWSEAGDSLEQKHHLVGLSLGVVGVDVDGTGQYGAASSLDSYVTVWSMGDYSTVHQFTNIPPSETWGLAFAPAGAAGGSDGSDGGPKLLLAVAGGSANCVRLLDVTAQGEAAVLAMPEPTERQRREKFVLSVAYSPDGRRIAAGGMDGTVAVFDAPTGKLLHTLDGHFKPVRDLTFTPDSKQVITACDDNHAHMYDAEHGELIEAFSGHESWVLSVSAHPGGNAFATGSSDGKVKLWDLATRTCAQTCSEHTDQDCNWNIITMVQPSRPRAGLVARLLTNALALAAAAPAAGDSLPPDTGPHVQIDCSGYQLPTPDLTPDFLGPLRHATAGNNRFAYRRFQLGDPPDATPMVLLMGYGGTMSDWGLTLLHRLAQHREIIIFDNPAQGLSEEMKPGDAPLTPEGLEESTLAFISSLNLTRMHVAGWSLGACAALKLAAFHPDRVSKVVAWGGTSPDGRAVTGSLGVMKTLFNPHNQDEDYAAQNFNLSSPAGHAGACFWITDKRRMPKDGAKPEVNLRYSKGVMRAIRPWNWGAWTALKRCSVPVLLMGGEEDIIIPPSAQTKLAAHVPGAWLAQFPNAGHGFLWQHMDQMLAVMEAFLTSGGSSSEAQSGGGGGGGADTRTELYSRFSTAACPVH
ncbi:WD repeat-containing 61 [Micractinium conductrix]|uniref:WD repeat-containing 61 n=1 Tax=Micractinium conductrix TaxID=554055 RepID=A0A2P6VLM8_9CHLO|nr:WD repeat-containing 61 [Micractinium conductrix]|eukprot:PSC74984.1 WD repeat-containing 61 [Micractinium conductrix]